MGGREKERERERGGGGGGGLFQPSPRDQVRYIKQTKSYTECRKGAEWVQDKTEVTKDIYIIIIRRRRLMMMMMMMMMMIMMMMMMMMMTTTMMMTMMMIIMIIGLKGAIRDLFTISSLRRELSPTRALWRSGHNRVQIRCSA